jgi:uncharacterized protein (TIGR02996 family)
MTQNDVLLRAVREAPEDDGPRLAYADWLEANGEAARAELIRVQCQLARLPPEGEQAAALHKRERALLKANEAAWRAPLPHDQAIVWGPFERGFVASVEVDPPEGEPFAGPNVRRLLARVAEGCAQAPITRLHFFGPTPANAQALARWPCLAGFTSLHLEIDPDAGVCIEAIGARALARSPHLANLRQLNLGVQEIGPEGARALADSPHLGRLTDLDLSGNDIGDAGVRALASSPGLASLTNLDLSDNEITDEGVRALADSPHLSALQVLNLKDNDFGAKSARVLRKRFGKRVQLD